MMNTRHGTGSVAALMLGCTIASSAVHAEAPASARTAWERLERRDPGDVLVIAHRGCWGPAPENSLAALATCMEIGADGLELDVHHTKDGVAVLLHDETVDRTTDGSGRIDNLSWAEVSKLRLRQGHGGPSAPLTDERVPTLAGFLDAARNRVAIVFDVKDGTQAKIFAAVREARMQRQAIFFYECSNDRLLDKVASFRDQVIMFPIMFERDGPLGSALRRCRSNPAGLAHVKYQHQEWLDAATPTLRASDTRLWVATMFAEDVAGADDRAALREAPAVWGRHISSGAVVIMTDQPRALIQYLRNRKPAGDRGNSTVGMQIARS